MIVPIRPRPPPLLRRGTLVIGTAGLVAYLVALGFVLAEAELPPVGSHIVAVLVGALGGVLLSKYLLGQLFRLALTHRDHGTTRRTAFAAALVGTATARLLPAGGALAPVAMAWAVRSEDDRAAGAALRITVLGYGGLLVVTGTAMAVAGSSMGHSAGLAGLAIPGIVVTVIGILVLMSVRWLRRVVLLLPERLRAHLESAELAGRITPAEAGLVLARIVVEAAVLWLVLAGLDVDTGPVEALVLFGVASVFRSMPFTPGGLGTVEGGTLGLLLAMGHAVDQAAAAVLVYRLIDYWAMAGIGLAVAARLVANDLRSEVPDDRSVTLR